MNFDTYPAQSNVKYAENNGAGLTEILQQEYIAFVCNSGLEPYFNWKRAQSANTNNYNAEIAQYGNVNDINGIMLDFKLEL